MDMNVGEGHTFEVKSISGRQSSGDNRKVGESFGRLQESWGKLWETT